MKDHFTLDTVRRGARQTAEEAAKEALEKLQRLSYDAAVRMEELLKSPSTSDNAKAALIALVMDRVYGKPEEMLLIRSSERAVAESNARIQAYADTVAEQLEHSNTRTPGTRKEEADVPEGDQGPDPV